MLMQVGLQLRAQGAELMCSCTEQQLRLLVTLVQQPKQQMATTTSNVQAQPAPNATPNATPNVQLNVAYQMAVLILTSSYGRVVSTALHNLDLQMRTGAGADVAQPYSFRAAIGSWAPYQPKAAHRRSQHSPRRHLLAADAQGADARGDAVAMGEATLGVGPPQLEVEHSSQEASSAYTLRFRLGLGGLGYSKVWTTRFVIMTARRLCACGQTCFLCLKATRVVTLFCCCLPVFRSLVCAAVTELCTRTCCRRRPRPAKVANSSIYRTQDESSVATSARESSQA